MEFIAFIGNEKENLGQITALLNRIECEKIFLIKDKKTENNFSNKKVKFIDVDTSNDLISLRKEMREKLKKELSGDFEVFLSIASGNGKEHMALISALLNVPVGIKLVAFTKNGIEFLN